MTYSHVNENFAPSSLNDDANPANHPMLLLSTGTLVINAYLTMMTDNVGIHAMQTLATRFQLLIGVVFLELIFLQLLIYSPCLKFSCILYITADHKSVLDVKRLYASTFLIWILPLNVFDNSIKSLKQLAVHHVQPVLYWIQYPSTLSGFPLYCKEIRDLFKFLFGFQKDSFEFP